MSGRWLLAATAVVLGVCVHGCSYPHYAGPLRPTPEQGQQLTVADDGTVTFTRDRLEIALRPMSRDELVRRFPAASQPGVRTTNPYVFSEEVAGPLEQEPQRFTVFLLSVKNYAFPKVRIDPARIVLRTANGREYWSLGLEQLDSYFRAYALGFRGNEHRWYKDLMDVLARTLYQGEEVFSGQEATGYVVFPALHPDVKELQAEILEAHLRFDYRNEPVETVSVSYGFERDTGRLTPQGVVLAE